jgi:hypothetical protein
MIVMILFNCCFDIKGQDNVQYSEERDIDSVDICKCLDPVLRRITKNRIVFQKYDKSGLIIKEEEIFFKEENVSVKDSSVMEWIPMINQDDMQIYHLHDKNDNYYLLCSFCSGCAGLATNLLQWLLIDINTKTSFYLRSFSDKADFFYLDTRTGILHFILFDYSEEWLDTYRDYHNYAFDVVYCIYNKGKYKAINRKTVKCNAYKP